MVVASVGWGVSVDWLDERVWQQVVYVQRMLRCLMICS